MMDYFDLLQLRNAIQDIDFDAISKISRQCDIEFSTIKHSFPSVDFHRKEYGDFRQSVQSNMAVITNALASIESEKQDYLTQIYKIVRDETFERIREDNIKFQKPESLFKSADYWRQYAGMPCQDSTKEMIKARIGAHVDWRFPGLEIGPGDGEMTNLMVASDPLYIVDYNIESIEQTKKQFSKQYQNRLRCYTNDGYSLAMLPQGQMGIVFSWNTFNFLSMDHIKKYLIEIFKVLRPGGVCIFSYNNAERPFAARQSDRNFMTFVPETILLKVIRSLGYTDVKAINKDTLLSWVEFKKPGMLTSTRTGQTLGKIIRADNIKT